LHVIELGAQPGQSASFTVSMPLVFPFCFLYMFSFSSFLSSVEQHV
jgi:hypothetical protein